MTLFWVASLVLVAISVLLIALPFINKKSNNDQQLRDELNKAFYKDRLEELEEETQEGLVANQQELIDDLKQSLLDDIPTEQKTARESKVSALMVIIPSALLVIAISYGMYFKFGALDSVKKWQQVSADLPALSEKLMSSDGQALSHAEMQNLTLALRTRLYYQPDDSTGWLLLGRVALGNRDMHTAIGAMKHAYELQPDNMDIILGYSQALMMSQDQTDQAKARKLLISLVQQDNVDIRVFSLLAFDAFERKDFAAAVRYWSIMQKMIGPQDSRYQMLSRSIEKAQMQMGKQIGSGKSVSVHIKLGKNVTADMKGSLIVSVHSANGAPMPIAAARYPVGSLPRTVVLNDANSMLETQKLSSLDSFIVRVRIDSDGNVATKQGDWFGESEVVKMNQPVEVMINSQYK